MTTLKTCTQLNLHKYPKDNIFEYFRRGIVFHKDVGFDALDFPMKEIGFLLEEKTDAGWRKCIEQVKTDAQDSKIRFEICHLPFTIWSRISHDESLVKNFEQTMLNSVDAAALLGVDYAVLHPNSVTICKDDFCEEKEFEICMKHLAPISDYAQKRGVHLALENLGASFIGENLYRYSQRAEEVCRMADALETDVCWDFGHANISGATQSEELKIIGSRLKVLHVNDNLGYGDDHLPPYLGTIDWTDAMSGLKAVGFDGLFNYEIQTATLPGEVRDTFAKYLIDTAINLTQ